MNAAQKETRTFWDIVCVNCLRSCTIAAGARRVCDECRTTDPKELQFTANANSRHAHYVVQAAIQSGQLPRLDGSVQCVDCGKPAVDYDHREYAKPLQVEPVCRSCNLLRGPAIDSAQRKLT